MSQITDHTELTNVPSGMRKICAKEDSRYPISGVLVSPRSDSKEAWLTATNGHAAAITTVPAVGNRNPPDPIPRRVLPKDRSFCSIDRKDKWYGPSEWADADDNAGVFPPVQDVLREIDTEKAYVIGICPKLLKNLASAISGDEDIGVSLIIQPEVDTDSNGTKSQNMPVCVVSNNSLGIGVIMPVSTERKIAIDHYITQRDLYLKDHPSKLTPKAE